MRCGCTNPCPACPGADYVAYLDGSLTPLDIPLNSVTPVTRTLISQQVTIPAGLPGLGLIASASGSFSLFGENTGAVVVTALLLDGIVIQASVLGNTATFGTMPTDSSEVDAILGAVNPLAPGVHTIIYQVTAQLNAGSGTLRVNSATMQVNLKRADNLTVTGVP